MATRELSQCGFRERLGGVGDDIPLLTTGREVLTHDVVSVVGEDLVDLGQHARHVDVQVAGPEGRLADGCLDFRQVDRQGGAAVVREGHELAGDEVADLFLCLLRRAADVRGEDDVVEAAQR